MTTASSDRKDARTEAMYAALEEGMISRDQEKASDILYDLIRAGRPLDEMLLETVRIHGPYTQAPFHQRLDDGFVRFVNNDHCLLSGRLALRMPEVLSGQHRFLPIAQTMWYVPTGLDAWNQLLGKAPGHYGRNRYDPVRYPVPPAPEIYNLDVPALEHPEEIGTLNEQLNEWLTLVMRNQAGPAFSLLKGMLRNPANRERVAAQMVFAGLIDIQDRMLYVTSYTTGHKSFRARATVELADAVGWDRADPIIYAGAPDLAVGPHYYANYEMACRVMMTELDDDPPISTLAATPESSRDSELFEQEADLSIAEREGLMHTVLREPDPAYIHMITGLLKSGRSPKKILDTIQIAASQVVLEAGEPENFGMPQHCYEYTNTLAWFYGRFTHRHRTKLLYVAGSFVNQAAMKLRNTPGNGRPLLRAPAGSDRLSRNQVLRELEAATDRLEPDEAASWVQAYLDGGYERRPLLDSLAMSAAKHGNDPHNQELGFAFLEDYARTSSPDRDRLLLACAKHTAGHRKYGDSLELYYRFSEAFRLDAHGTSQGEGDPIEAALDDIEEIPLEELPASERSPAPAD
ncbi:MAG: hypothetical protein F4X25_01195 [Chloroflexi bacterium]|nr:hypothetical protein [Chloroflexota bacterium]